VTVGITDLLKEVAFTGSLFYFYGMNNIQKRARPTILLFLFIFYCHKLTFIYGQGNFGLKIISVMDEMALVNSGSLHGLRNGEMLIVKRWIDPEYLHVGIVQTLEVREQRAAVKLVEPGEKSELMVGDLLFRTEEEFLRKTEGFRRLAWGTDRSRIDGLVYIFTDSLNTDLRYYGMLGDDLIFGGADIVEILYGFRSDKFYSVDMFFKGIDNFSRLFSYCIDAFGETETIEADINGYEWSGERSIRQLIYNTESGKGLVVWRVNRFAPPHPKANRKDAREAQGAQEKNE